MYTLGTQYQTNPVLLCSPQIQYTSLTLYYFVHLRWYKTPDSSCIIMYSSDILYQIHPVSFCTPQVGQTTRLILYYYVHHMYAIPD